MLAESIIVSHSPKVALKVINSFKIVTIDLKFKQKP